MALLHHLQMKYKLPTLSDESSFQSNNTSSSNNSSSSSSSSENNTSLSEHDDSSFDDEKKHHKHKYKTRLHTKSTAEIRAQKMRYMEMETRIRELETNMEKQKQEFNTHHTNEKEKWEMRLHELHMQLQTQRINAERTKQRAIAAEQTRMRDTYQQQQQAMIESLGRIDVDETKYLEYVAVEAEKRTVHQVVAIQVYEMLQKERMRTVNATHERDTVRRKNVTLETELEACRRERETAVRQLSGSEHTLLEEIKQMHQRKKQLETNVTQMNARIDELTHKGQQYDALHKQFIEVQMRAEELNKQTMSQAASLKVLTEERENSYKRLEDQDKQLDILRLDKAYLTKEIESLNQRLQSEHMDRERIENKVQQLKKQRDDLVDKITKVHDDNRRSFEDKLNNELQRIQARAQQDLDTIRVSQKEAYEREIAGLREARDSVAALFENTRADLRSTSDSLTTVQEEMRKLETMLETERVDFQNALKIKQFELDRLNISFEELSNENRKARLQLEGETQKLQMMRTDHTRLQHDADTERVRLTNEIDSLKEKLATYQQLEYELDLAIVRAGSDDANKAGKPGFRAIDALLDNIGGSLPTSNKRRIKQSILLAQQLVEKQRLIEQLQADLKQALDRAADLDTKLTAAEFHLHAANQPANYLIAQLRQREDELTVAKRTLTEYHERVISTEAENNRLLELKEQLENNLRAVLMQRSNLTALKDVLSKVHPMTSKSTLSTIDTNIAPSTTQSSLEAGRHEPAAREWFERLRRHAHR